MQENRRRTRVQSSREGTILVEGTAYPFVTENLSLHGLKCRCTTLPPEDTACVLVLPLAAGLEIRIEAAIIRAQDGTVAVDFMGMDEESYAHLRNIVRFMAEDPDAIDDEQAFRAFRD